MKNTVPSKIVTQASSLCKSNREKGKAIKAICEKLYIEDDKTIEELALFSGVSDKTIYRWVKDGNWIGKKSDAASLEKQIEINMKKALNKGLQDFAIDSNEKDLQSLVGLIRQYNEKHKPTQAYKDNILKFLDKTTDFLLEKNMTDTANIFKSCLIELAEFLLRS